MHNPLKVAVMGTFTFQSPNGEVEVVELKAFSTEKQTTYQYSQAGTYGCEQKQFISRSDAADYYQFKWDHFNQVFNG